MLPFLVVFISFLGVDARQEQDQFALRRPLHRCFANEEFSSCVSACEPTCAKPDPGICTTQCVAGCKCKSGFLRNERGACVANCTDESSTPACATNEEFMECGTACEPSCRYPTPKMCTLQCVTGCQCKEGFFRNDKNDCVDNCNDEPANICPENEEFRTCGTACEPSCKNPNPVICTAQCIVNVCQCKPGFFRNSSNKCVADCSSDTCGVNEELKKCGTACEPTCDNPTPRCTKQCVVNVCQCRDGYIRGANSSCIPKQECPGSSTQSPTDCAGITCPPGTVCRMIETTSCDKPPCSSHPHCTQVMMCGEHETWTNCSRCEPTCTNMNPACALKCGPPRCECNPDFFRSEHGACISMTDCLQKDNKTPRR